MEDLLMDMILHPEFTEALFRRLADFYVAVYRNYLQTVGDFIQMLIYYEDLSGQDGPLISPAMYRKYVKPCHRRIFQEIRKYPDKTVYLCFDSDAAGKSAAAASPPSKAKTRRKK